MFIGFIYFLVVMIITTFFGGLVESKTEKKEKESKLKNNKQINKIKNVNRKWFDIDVK